MRSVVFSILNGKSGLGRILLFSTLACLASCSRLPSVPIPGMDYIAGEEGLLRDRQGDYLEAQVLPRTRIPEQYDGYIIDDLMVIPQIPGNNTQAFLNPPRPVPFAGRSERGVVIQRMEGDSWIVVDVGPSEVWPRVRDYWARKGIQVAFENPTRGLLDTSWFVLENNTITKEKMRVLVEPGFQNDSAEIRLLHLSSPQAVPSIERVNWPESSSDADLEFDFLTDLSQYLADVADLYQASSVSFLAENINSRGKASLVRTPGGREILRLDAGYDRSWAAISRALDRVGVEVAADSKEQGIYEVDYVMGLDEEEEKPGLFKRIYTLNGVFSRKDPVQSYPMKIQVLEVDGQVEVIVESLELSPQQSADLDEVETSLLRLIRSNIT